MCIGVHRGLDLRVPETPLDIGRVPTGTQQIGRVRVAEHVRRRIDGLGDRGPQSCTPPSVITSKAANGIGRPGLRSQPETTLAKNVACLQNGHHRLSAMAARYNRKLDQSALEIENGIGRALL
jgi:hypothetical protein